ncbi:head-tail adaptor protein [Ancylobacter pratisalsi]|uniref:Head-tail adaptor protein n=1 Tax=Ancylobacter pratisalsi TaxID=1745854 RepID=A0A6P1YU04_9HYPH|nr:head-tail adaptor protein [Ancylobacter pratisalsi]QIB35094.1 head-tail adaptor protein [Ancylobacter pratisalsi]
MSGISELRHRFIHQVPVETPDGMGGVSRNFLAVDSLWGAVETSASAAEIADRPGAVLTHQVNVRAPATVQPGDRLLLGARCFLVETVHDRDGRGRRLVCGCREETP